MEQKLDFSNNETESFKHENQRIQLRLFYHD